MSYLARASRLYYWPHLAHSAKNDGMSKIFSRESEKWAYFWNDEAVGGLRGGLAYAAWHFFNLQMSENLQTSIMAQKGATITTTVAQSFSASNFTLAAIPSCQWRILAFVKKA